MNANNLIDKKVSFQTTAWTPLTKEMTIREVISEIKSDKYLKQIESLRAYIQNAQLDEYNIHKKNLPAVTFCSTFDQKRRRELIKEYNYIIVLDIDKLSPDEFQRVKIVLREDEFVFVSWESPSQNGLKGLVSLKYKAQIDSSNVDLYHKHAFRKLQNYFLEKYNIELDESGSDTTRLCFVSHDSSIEIKENVEQFLVEEVEFDLSDTKSKASGKKLVKEISKRDALYNPEKRNNPYHRRMIQAIIKYLTKRSLSITYTYEEWYRVAIAIANSFTYEIGEKYFLNLCRIDKDKFNETACINMLIYAYENRRDEISFKTIEYFANQKGYKTRNQKEVVTKVGNES